MRIQCDDGSDDLMDLLCRGRQSRRASPMPCRRHSVSSSRSASRGRRRSEGRCPSSERRGSSHDPSSDKKKHGGRGFATHNAQYHDVVKRRWGAKSTKELGDMVLEKLGSVSYRGKIDKDVQPLLMEFIDRILDDATLVARNLGNVACSQETARLLSLSNLIVNKHVRVRSLRVGVKEEMLAFVDVFETASLSGRQQRSSGPRFMLFVDYFPLLMKPDYSDHTQDTVRSLVGMGMGVSRSLMILATYVVELFAALDAYRELVEKHV